MRALVIEHDPGSQPGLVGAALVARGFRLEPVVVSTSLDHATWHGDFPDPVDYDLVVSLGAVWSLYDRAVVGTWIDRELALLRRADEHGVPVLGICFGGQALAAAHGGRVEPAPRKEIGFTPVETRDADLVPPGPWMQWHGDRFTVPDGAVELAHNDVGPQAFRLRRNLALQFHPEADEQLVRSWLQMGAELAARDLADAGRTAEEVLAGARARADTLAADVDRLVGRYLDDVAGLGAGEASASAGRDPLRPR